MFDTTSSSCTGMTSECPCPAFSARCFLLSLFHPCSRSQMMVHVSLPASWETKKSFYFYIQSLVSRRQTRNLPFGSGATCVTSAQFSAATWITAMPKKPQITPGSFLTLKKTFRNVSWVYNYGFPVPKLHVPYVTQPIMKQVVNEMRQNP